MCLSTRVTHMCYRQNSLVQSSPGCLPPVMWYPELLTQMLSNFIPINKATYMHLTAICLIQALRCVLVCLRERLTGTERANGELWRLNIIYLCLSVVLALRDRACQNIHSQLLHRAQRHTHLHTQTLSRNLTHSVILERAEMSRERQR